MKILEGATAFALLFDPAKAKLYLKEIGIESEENAEAEIEESPQARRIFNIHDLKPK